MAKLASHQTGSTDNKNHPRPASPITSAQSAIPQPTSYELLGIAAAPAARSRKPNKTWVRYRFLLRAIKGWFDESLPGFLSDHDGPFQFIHVDCDTYEAANTLFELIEPNIVPGTVIVFDEYFGYQGWKIGEYKAWQELVERQGIRISIWASLDNRCRLR